MFGNEIDTYHKGKNPVKLLTEVCLPETQFKCGNKNKLYMTEYSLSFDLNPSHNWFSTRVCL